MVNMKTLVEHESASDSQLVDLCLRGNRNAFAQIVARYQSLICSIAYSDCGDIGRSEDLAQDTFLAAWKRLGELKEPEKLKRWLCGIARNLTISSIRQQHRTPTDAAEPLLPESPSGAATPREEAITREEAALMWRTLETIPQNYREPMILFYRENQSTQAVAAALDISEDAVRQRLSRGREMLTDRMAKTVELTLLKSAPGQAFTMAVYAALPAVTISTKAAAGATAAKGGAAAKAAGLLGFFSWILSPILCFLGLGICYGLERDDSRSAEMRLFVGRYFRNLAAAGALFLIAVLVLAGGGRLAHLHPEVYAGLWITLPVAYVIFAFILAARMRPQRRSVASAELREPVFEYRSKWSLLGLPLIHIRMRAGMERGPVKAWIAAGDSAIGVLFAFGGRAIAPISVGGISIGLFTFGGFAIGLITFGGFSLGVWAMGAFAFGWQAFGVSAVGWLSAQGGMLAAAHGFARDGTVTMAVHAGDAAAASFFKDNAFNHIALAILRYANWAYVMYLFPLVMWWRVRRLKKSREAAQAAQAAQVHA
jgi:RNA polymerase sigma factor (sigma-70 family)